MKKVKNNILLSLYTSYIFQRTTKLVITISFIILTLFLYFNASSLSNDSKYLINYEDIHNAYFSQSILVVEILNSIICCIISYLLASNSLSFDSLFISYISRKKIYVSKIIVIFIVVLNIILIEELLILGLGTFKFSRLVIDYQVFLSFIYLYISLMFEVLVYLLLSSISNNIFVPIIGLFVSIVTKITLNNNSKLICYIEEFIPTINIDSFILKMNNPIIGFIYIILFSLLFLSVNEIKEIHY